MKGPSGHTVCASLTPKTEVAWRPGSGCAGVESSSLKTTVNDSFTYVDSNTSFEFMTISATNDSLTLRKKTVHSTRESNAAFPHSPDLGHAVSKQEDTSVSV